MWSAIFNSVIPHPCRPLGAVADMINALTRTIASLDRQPPEELTKYQDIRSALLSQSLKFLELTLEVKASFCAFVSSFTPLIMNILSIDDNLTPQSIFRPTSPLRRRLERRRRNLSVRWVTYHSIMPHQATFSFHCSCSRRCKHCAPSPARSGPRLSPWMDFDCKLSRSP